MKLNYKKELEQAAKSMILIHDPQTMMKMIVRTMTQKINVRHAGILLYYKDRDTYILNVSRGERGLKIPAGFARMDPDNVLIKFLKERKTRSIFKEDWLTAEKIKNTLKRKTSRLAGRQVDKKLKEILTKLKHQLEILEAEVCIPSYFQDDLLGVLILGKKNSNKKFKRDELDFFVALASDVSMAIRNAQLFSDLQKELDSKHHLFIHTTIALAAAIDAKDHYTHGHTARVTNYSLAILNKLIALKKINIDDKFKENLHIAALLHDIGKIGIPENILNKQDRLSEEERKKIEEHPLIGITILGPIKELNQDCIDGIKYHHEKFDGTGYPEKLKGKKIPLSASIISVADTFDAITTDRPYRKGLTKQEAIEELNRCSGIQFDSTIVKAMNELFKEGKI